LGRDADTKNKELITDNRAVSVSFLVSAKSFARVRKTEGRRGLPLRAWSERACLRSDICQGGDLHRLIGRKTPPAMIFHKRVGETKFSVELRTVNRETGIVTSLPPRALRALWVMALWGA